MPEMKLKQINPIDTDDNWVDSKTKYKVKPRLQESSGINKHTADSKDKMPSKDRKKKPSLTESSEDEDPDRYSPVKIGVGLNPSLLELRRAFKLILYWDF